MVVLVARLWRPGCVTLAVSVAGACSSSSSPRSTSAAPATSSASPPSTALPPSTVSVTLVAGAETGEDTRPPPGALNPSVTQDNIASTICVRGWTKGVRPPASYTGALKRMQIARRHLRDTVPAHYEEDHAIPLELGGAAADPNNLWPEPIAAARRADQVEGQLHDNVCAGRMTLGSARAAILDYKRTHGWAGAGG